jgi:hypothetical protein
MMPLRQNTPGLLIAAALCLVACGKSDSTTTTTTTVTVRSTSAPGGTTTPAKAATPLKPGEVLTPEDAMARFTADKASLMGKRVKIKGYYVDYTKQGDKVNVELDPKPDVMSKGPLCQFPASALGDLDKLKKKTQITASGTVDGEFFGRPLLKDCKLE